MNLIEHLEMIPYYVAYTDLSEVKFETKYVAQRQLVNNVSPQQRNVKGMLLWMTFKPLQNYIKNSVGIQIKTTCTWK